MSFVNSKIAANCTRSLLVFMVASTAVALEVDFSRRQVDFSRVQNEDRLPASVQEDQPIDLLSKVFEPIEVSQDIVIMNTEKGFVPQMIHLKKGSSYRIHIVNVNSKEKNISFVLDAFSEHHNTVFGEQKAFSVTPQVDGIFSYQCPETAVQGKLVVSSESTTSSGSSPALNNRKPASN